MIINEEFLNELLGRTEFYCRCVIEDAGFTWRVVFKDGEHLICNDNYNHERVNLCIKDGRIISASIG